MKFALIIGRLRYSAIVELNLTFGAFITVETFETITEPSIVSCTGVGTNGIVTVGIVGVFVKVYIALVDVCAFLTIAIEAWQARTVIVTYLAETLRIVGTVVNTITRIIDVSAVLSDKELLGIGTTLGNIFTFNTVTKEIFFTDTFITSRGYSDTQHLRYNHKYLLYIHRNQCNSRAHLQSGKRN